VTRVARVTGLDRAGVEVACAIRPGGHVLQVTNGKGLRQGDAALGALLEAAELACAEAVPPEALTCASPAELRARGVAHLAPGELGGAAADPGRLAWRAGVELRTSRPTFVPAAAVHAPPQGGPSLGLADLRWTSNGMGAHPSRDAALAHALLEAAERHALARALPDGWTEEACARTRLASPHRIAPRADALARRIAERGFEVHLFRLPSELGIPLAAALLFDRHAGPVPLTAGYASRLELDAAAVAALLEAAQSRLTDIHGAREDVGPMDHRAVERLRRACVRTREPLSPALSPPGGGERETKRPVTFGHRPSPPPGERGRGGGDDAAEVTEILSRFHRAGFPRAVAVDLAPPGLGVHVVKVLVPGFALSELL
jgi:ribosomal protein S12 methylthiotransferase accessory factor